MVRTLFLVFMAFLVGSCSGDDGPPEVPNGSAGFYQNQILAPGAEILVRGQTFTDTAPADPDQLAVIVREGESFFYHPAMSVRPLTVENSKQAIGYFMNAPERTITTVQQPLLSLDAGETATSQTGLEAFWKDPQARVVTLENQAKRWAAAKGDGEDVTRFLMPRDDILPTSCTDAVFDDFGGVAASTSIREVPTLEFIETHGAVARALPLLFVSSDFRISAELSHTFDPKLFEALNLLDILHVFYKGADTILGFVPLDCFDLINYASLKSAHSQLVTDVIGGSLAKDAVELLYKDSFKGLLSDFNGCITEAAAAAITGPAGVVVVEMWSFFTQVVTLGNFIFDEVLLGFWETWGGLAFDQIQVAREFDGPEVRNLTQDKQMYLGRADVVTFTAKVVNAASVEMRVTASLLGMGEGNSEKIAFPAQRQGQDTWTVPIDVKPDYNNFSSVTVIATSTDGTTDQLTFDVYSKLEKIYEGMVTFSHSVELDDGRTERCEITAPLQFIFTFSGANWPSTSSAKVKANRPSYGLNAEGLSATCTPRDNWQTNSMFVLSLDEDSLHIFINHIELDVEVTEDRIEGSGSFTGNDVFRFDGMSYPFTYVEAASFFVVAE